MWWCVLLIWCLTLTSADVCPQHCHCYKEQETMWTANCSTLALSVSTPGSQLDVLNLHAQHRSFHVKLTAGMFKHFATIKFLNMSNLTLKHLPNDVFYGLRHVMEIDLTYNKIKHLNGVVFKDLISLNTLSLRGNPLELSPWDLIISKSLREIDLGYCGLTKIPPDTFLNVGNLTHLVLDGNFLVTLEYKSVPSGLTYLNLANNKITNVPIDVLKSLHSLMRLDISNNPINCTCHLLLLQDWFSGQGKIFENGGTCATPLRFAGQQLSKIYEGELCEMEFMHKERHMNNDIKNFRDFRKKQNMISDHAVLQADQPFIDNDYNNRYRDSLVMFANDDTKKLGSHLEIRSSSNFNIDPAENNEELGSAYFGEEKLDEPPQDISNPDSTHDSTHKFIEPVKSDETDNTDVYDNQKSSTHDIEKESDGKEIFKSTMETFDETNGSEEADENNYSTENKFDHNNPAIESLESSSASTFDYSNNIHALNTGNYTETYPSTAESEEIKVSTEEEDPEENQKETIDNLNKTSSTELFTSSDYDKKEETKDVHSTIPEYVEIQTENTSDVEVVSDMPSSMETMSKYSLDEKPVSSSSEFSDHIYTGSDSSNETEESTTESNLYEHVFTWPSSPTENPDYSYDTQHDDYTSIETVYTTEHTEFTSAKMQESPSTEMPSSSSLPFTEEELEGSGEEEEFNSTTEVSSTVRWMEEQENETVSENYSVENVTDVFDDATESSTIEITTEYLTILTSQEVSTEPVTESSSEFYNSSFLLTSVSPEVSSPSPEISSSTESSDSPFTEKSEEEEVTTLSDISPTEDTPVSSSSSFPEVSDYDTTTESSSMIPVEEVEIFPEVAPTDVSEKLVVETSNEEFSKENQKGEKKFETFAIYIIAGLIIILVTLLIFGSLCKRKRNVKVRLPADPEANPGTELQDMLLPKPPENGIKVLPKNYTNGNPANGKPEQKEEETPVLAEPEPEPEPEPDWEDKLGPIEAVTARLSVLARPQTPIFIHKSLN